jgi:beta-galactosidase
VAERIERFVAGGGTFVTTYFSGVVDESDLAFLNGFPGPLRKLMGVWAEEIDTLYDDESVAIVPRKGNDAGLSRKYEGRQFCDLIHTEGATVLATYGGEFYKGRPAVTVNEVGRGRAYYIASRNDARFHADFYGKLIGDLQLERALGVTLPEGVTADVRTDGERRFVFLLSFSRKDTKIDLGGAGYHDVIGGERVGGKMSLPSYSALVLEALPQAQRRAGKPKKRAVARR